jgi:hypothetical protein
METAGTCVTSWFGLFLRGLHRREPPTRDASLVVGTDPVGTARV